jgi:hypothetical protein
VRGDGESPGVGRVPGECCVGGDDALGGVEGGLEPLQQGLGGLHGLGADVPVDAGALDADCARGEGAVGEGAADGAHGDVGDGGDVHAADLGGLASGQEDELPAARVEEERAGEGVGEHGDGEALGDGAL